MESQLTLEPEPGQVALARRFVEDALSSWDRDHNHDTAVLLANELVTNAVLHTHAPVTVTVRHEPPVVTVEVEDRSDRPPRRSTAGSTSTSGRGISLVDALADDWGIRSLPGDGKVVWFSLTAE
jgi:anti-sigma regulatory factor (Ser/Thr protein kinase)